jgi:hypothetical protein
VIARCSVKTVRRAYATGVLTAYRRRGSRAVLLEDSDVQAWAQGEVLRPSVSRAPALQSARARPLIRRSARPEGQPSRARAVGGEQRFDLSADALRDRRNANPKSLL